MKYDEVVPAQKKKAMWRGFCDRVGRVRLRDEKSDNVLMGRKMVALLVTYVRRTEQISSRTFRFSPALIASDQRGSATGSVGNGRE